MTPFSPDSAWRNILDLCDEIGALKRRIGDGRGSRSTLTRLREEAQRRAVDLRKRLGETREPGVFADLARRHGLTEDDLSLLAHLLTRTFAPGRADIAGRDLLDLVCDSTFEKLAALAILRPDGALRRSGLVVVTSRARGGNDPLDVRFRLADRVARRFTGGPAREALRPLARGPYPDEHDYLLDLRDLASLHRERAGLLFEEIDGEGGAADGNLRDVRLRIQRFWRAIERRLRATKQAENFRFETFRREFGLGEEEVLSVVALLFQETFEADPFVAAVDLLKMVSDGEPDALRKRALFARDGRLVTKGIVTLEDSIAEKDISSVVCLGNWVVERLLGGRTRDEGIPPDERIDFHLYLDRLDSSARFYRDLRKSGPSR